MKYRHCVSMYTCDRYEIKIINLLESFNDLGWCYFSTV